MSKLETIYVGDGARRYNERREHSDIWQREQATVGAALRSLLQPGDRVLDVAAGTGRWLELYAERRVEATLLDVSGDMLKVAAAQAAALGVSIDLVERNVLTMPALPPGEWLISTRFFNWISLRSIERLLRMAMAAGYRHVAVTMRCVDHAAPWAQRLGARWRWRKKNVRVLLGIRRKGTYYLQSRVAFAAMLGRLGCTIATEHAIERPSGEAYTLFIIHRL